MIIGPLLRDRAIRNIYSPAVLTTGEQKNVIIGPLLRDRAIIRECGPAIGQTRNIFAQK